MDKIIVSTEKNTFTVEDPPQAAKNDVMIHGENGRLPLADNISAKLETDTTRYIY